MLFADMASSAPPSEALASFVSVSFFIFGGLAGLAVFANQARQFFKGEEKPADRFATVGQLDALETRLTNMIAEPLKRIYHIDKILALLAEKSNIDPRKYET